ncbi:hypothetical protein ACHAPJ_007088 [Fusarium lateritium]
MANRYTIQVQNQSGIDQEYALFNQPPRVSGRHQDQVWSNVFATGRAPTGSTTSFEVSKQYYAITGTSMGSPQDGVQVEVSSWRPVKLGSSESNETSVPGTTLSLAVQDDMPQFSDSPRPDGAYPNAFEIQTGNDFTLRDAKSGGFLIGLGGSQSGNDIDGPLATFLPEPCVEYHIEPSNTYYLTYGRYTKGSMIDVNKVGRSVTIAFSSLPSNDVVIVHDDYGKLRIQRG